jgi:monoamine oxidase
LQRTCGEPILLALIVGEAAQAAESQPDSDVIRHAVQLLRKLFGTEAVAEPITARVTHWGSDRFSRGAYSYVAVGATGKDYDLMAAPVERTLFFAGEATCRVRVLFHGEWMFIVAGVVNLSSAHIELWLLWEFVFH